EAPHNVNDHGSTSAEALLFAIAGTAATTGSNDVYLGGEPLVVLGPEHARTFADSGWSKADVKRAIWERARVRLDRFSPENRQRFGVIDPERFRGRLLAEDVALCASPDDLPAQLTATRHQVEAGDAIEFCFRQGWTDGLPAVPPTADRVGAMLAGARLDPTQEIGFVAHRAVSITAEKVAINAVMAGCTP